MLCWWSTCLWFVLYFLHWYTREMEKWSAITWECPLPASWVPMRKYKKKEGWMKSFLTTPEISFNELLYTQDQICWHEKCTCVWFESWKSRNWFCLMSNVILIKIEMFSYYRTKLILLQNFSLTGSDKKYVLHDVDNSH